mgnify:CR=1 FL=1
MNPETILNALYDLWAKEHGETVEIEIVKTRKEYETWESGSSLYYVRQ